MELNEQNWLDFYKNNPQQLKSLNKIFKNFDHYKNAFNALPIYSKHHLIFNQKCGYGQFNEYSANWLAQGLNEIVFNNQVRKIMITHENEFHFNYSISNFKNKLSSISHNLYEFDNNQSVSFNFAFYAANKANMEYLIHFINHPKTKNVSIIIYNFKRGFNNYLLDSKYQELLNYLNKNDLKNFEFKPYSATKMDYIILLDEYASKDKMLKAFANIKEKRKIKNLIVSNSQFTNDTFEIALKKYETDFSIQHKLKKFISKFSFIDMLYYSREKNNNIFFYNSENRLTIYSWLKEKYYAFNQHEIVMIYLDFLLEELKVEGQVNLNNLFVILPINAPIILKTLLNRYKIKMIFESENKYEDLINDPNCIFFYSEYRYIANPRFSFYYDNHYFNICLIWMFNRLLNRNNLLAYKWKQILENLGRGAFYTKKYSIPKNIQTWKNVISYMQKNYKNILIKELDYKNDLFHYLCEFTISNVQKLIIKKSFIENKIFIEYQLYEEINDEILNYKNDEKILNKYLHIFLTKIK